MKVEDSGNSAYLPFLLFAIAMGSIQLACTLGNQYITPEFADAPTVPQASLDAPSTVASTVMYGTNPADDNSTESTVAADAGTPTPSLSQEASDSTVSEAADFSISSSNQTVPEDILEEVSFFAGGAGGGDMASQ